MSHRITVNARSSGPARTETVMGTTYRVFPATLVREQVLENNLGRTFLPADEINDRWAQTANMAPVVTDHPSQRGMQVSARNREVLNGLGAGFVFDARAEQGELKADVYLDPARAAEVADLKAVLGKLDRGETVELSTSFPTAVEDQPGAHNNRHYDKVLRPTGFDHLAVFAEKTGACSVDDGCGLAANHDGPCQCGGDSVNEQQVAEGIWERLKRLLTNHSKESAMEERVEALAANERCPFDADELTEFDEERITALEAAFSEPEPPREEPADNADGDQPPAWAEALMERVEKLEDETAPARNEVTQERTRLASEIAQNSEYTEDELGEKSLAELRKLRSLVRPKSYAGRGGPKSSETAELEFMPPKPYWAEDDDGED